jgi:S-adenosylmethionine:tRNA ribosyltransferase-isomerase
MVWGSLSCLMHISDFDYVLPPELIATEPVRPRDASRMMVLNRQTGICIDSRFTALPEFLQRGDVLVINDTRVLKARMYGELHRANGTTRTVELLFASPLPDGSWEVLCKPGKRVRAGDRVVLKDGGSIGIFGETRDYGLHVLSIPGEDVPSLLDRFGHVPLPPYIERPDKESDSGEYQTMFASEPGAIAAPTAGLHFTPEVLSQLEHKGIEVARITLHVGIGTFQPVREEDPRRHHLKPERFSISAETSEKLNAARACTRRIIAVGTTSARTLEYVVSRNGEVIAGSGEADIFILPGYRFKAMDGLLTNFHLPRSTLLMLVAAFSSRQRILEAYAHAVDHRYRFYSYGDCMLIL